MLNDKKKKGGRPPKPLKESRCVPVYFRFTPAEMATINARAGSVGLRRSEFCRNACLGKPLVPAINKQAYMQLAGIARNLNQFTKLAHKTQKIDLKGIDMILLDLYVIKNNLMGENQ